MTSERSAEVIYVTRKFPPSVGGMERLAADIAAQFDARFPIRLRALGRGQLHLFWWLPVSVVWLVLAIARSERPAVVFGDPIVATCLGPFARGAGTTMVVVHGLDLTYGLPGYRAVVRQALKRIDRVVAISRATADVAIEMGIEESCVEIVNPGVEIPPDPASAEQVRERFGFGDDMVVLTTVGRLVPRKGVSWFVEHVLPALPDRARYVVAGPGDPDTLRQLDEAIDLAGVRDRVTVAGRVDARTRELLLGGADIFVMPNLRLPGDMEGFGLVAAEATVRGTLVIASRLEGIVDALVDGAGGVLCEPGDEATWVETVGTYVSDSELRSTRAEEFREVALTRFSLERLGDELEALVAGPDVDCA
ncbi:MAG: glycosyltransferase family 4 protein [Actinomycetia bacterium]|nr:glycosyltransferase family 4 protein [Actinomycetes bacterium]